MIPSTCIAPHHFRPLHMLHGIRPGHVEQVEVRRPILSPTVDFRDSNIYSFPAISIHLILYLDYQRPEKIRIVSVAATVQMRFSVARGSGYPSQLFAITAQAPPNPNPSPHFAFIRTRKLRIVLLIHNSPGYCYSDGKGCFLLEK